MHGLDWYDYGARNYEPVLSRFTTMDPLAEKYYSISPYAYCAGNPVMFVDPDGRKIVISGTAEYVKQVKADLKQLSKDDADVRLMIIDLINSPNIHAIGLSKVENKFNYVEFNNADAKAQKSQGSTIGYDPKQNQTKSGEIRDPRVGLAHELKHSSDVDKGKMDMETETENGVPVREVDAIKTENKIREKTGDKKRTTYGNKEISNIWLDD